MGDGPLLHGLILLSDLELGLMSLSLLLYRPDPPRYRSYSGEGDLLEKLLVDLSLGPGDILPSGGCLISSIGGIPGNIVPGWKIGGTMLMGFARSGIPGIPGTEVGSPELRELIPGSPGRGGRDSGPDGLVGKEALATELGPEPDMSPWPRERLSKLADV